MTDLGRAARLLRQRLAGCLGAVWLLAWTAPARADDAPPTLVLAVASSRSFDTDLPDLRYARTDLDRFVDVVRETGRVPADRIVTLVDPTLKAFRAAVTSLKGKGGPHAKLLFYYSGHSDANGLHLADQRLDRKTLHDLLGSIAVDTRVAFLDSCYSGALAAKGVRPATEFQVPKAEVDEPSGSVFLAATGETDAAFEVDELQGSLFTHYLVSGLYGQADGNDDGLVTVDELYQFVYREVLLHNVVLPAAAAQKPEFRTELKGRGALVLSYPKQTTYPLFLGASLQGEITVSSDNGIRIQRLQKPAGDVRRIGLAAGTYRVVAKETNLVGRGALTVKPGQLASLERKDLTYEETGAALLVAKGKTSRPLYGLRAGTHRGLMNYSSGGVYAELDAATPSVRVHVTEWRLHALLGAQRHELLGSDGQATETELLGGVSGAYFLPWGMDGQQAYAFFGGGASRLGEHGAAADAAHHLKPSVQKIAFALGTSVPAASGWIWSLEFRREFLFVTDSANGDVLALAGNQLGLALHF